MLSQDVHFGANLDDIDTKPIKLKKKKKAKKV